MSQRDLFEPKPGPPRCGNCVTLNRVRGADFGHCSKEGTRRLTQKPCAEWFGLEELTQPPYGRRATRRKKGPVRAS